MTNKPLQNIVKGAGIIIIGAVIGTGLRFISKIIVARNITQTEYGIYSLALVVFNIFVTLSLLGLPEGITRQVSYHRDKVKEITSSSLLIASVSGIVFSAILYLSSGVISLRVFGNPGLTQPLRIFSVAIPFSVLMGVLISLFRGFGRADVNVVFQDFLRRIIFILFLFGAIIGGFSFERVIYAYTFSVIITCTALIIYSLKSIPVTKKFGFTTELLLFSVPLLITIVLNTVMNWTDTLMLGCFKTPDVVGLYNAASPLANFIPIFLTSAAFMYNPIASQLYSENKIYELKRVYQVITKWIFSATLPVFLVMFLFPEFVLNLIFGTNYIPAAFALKILILGLMFHVIMGLNGLSLIVLGKTNFVMYIALIGAIANVTLNIALIPFLGINGAAIASAASYISVNILASVRLYQISGIHPFTKNYIKPIFISLLLLTFIYLIPPPIDNLLILLIFLVLYLFGYIILLLLTKSFDREDIDLLLAIERRVGLNLKLIKKILKRFV